MPRKDSQPQLEDQELYEQLHCTRNCAIRAIRKEGAKNLRRRRGQSRRAPKRTRSSPPPPTWPSAPEIGPNATTTVRKLSPSVDRSTAAGPSSGVLLALPSHLDLGDIGQISRAEHALVLPSATAARGVRLRQSRGSQQRCIRTLLHTPGSQRFRREAPSPHRNAPVPEARRRVPFGHAGGHPPTQRSLGIDGRAPNTEHRTPNTEHGTRNTEQHPRTDPHSAPPSNHDSSRTASRAFCRADGCAGEVGAFDFNSSNSAPISCSFLRPRCSRTCGNHSPSSS